MDFKQNQKINQVTEITLVVGVDIAKRTHYACFVDDRGRVLQKSFSKDGRFKVAANSIGVTEGREMARIEIATLVRRYHQLEKDIESITQHLVELVKTSVEYEWLSTVPGLGETTIVDLLAEIGSFSHYENPRQLIKNIFLTPHQRVKPLIYQYL